MPNVIVPLLQDCPEFNSMQYRAMPTCEAADADVLLCEGNGECGTDDELNNCGEYNVYRR
jgi:hypothetical protein